MSDMSEVNLTLDQMEALVRQHYKRIIREQGIVTASMLKSACFGSKTAPNTLIKLFEQHNVEYRKRIGIDRTRGSYEHYEHSHRILREFLHIKYGIEDLRLLELDIAFINDFDLYLRADRHMSPVTVNNHIIYLRKLIRIAISNGTLGRDPFQGYRFDKARPCRRYLSGEELSAIMAFEPESRSVGFTRDLFVFSSMTGLALCDIKSLCRSHICPDSTDGLWIIKKREHTTMNSKVILLDIPRRIIEKYAGSALGDKIFHLPTSTTLSKHMRIISRQCRLSRNVTFSCARTGFATQVMLPHGMPIETISRMMGYRSAVSAQKFVDVTLVQVGNDMKILEQKIGNRTLPTDDQTTANGL